MPTMNMLQKYRFESQFLSVKWIVLGIITLVYGLIFLTVGLNGRYLLNTTIAVFPVIIGGLLFGASGGAVYALCLEILTLPLGVLFGYQSPTIIEIILGAVALTICGAITGWLRERYTPREPAKQQTDDAYRIVVETSVQGLVIFQDEKTVFANAAEADLTGYSVEELFAMTPRQTFEMTHPEDRDLVAGRLQDRAAGKTIAPRAEFRLLRKDGETRWVEMYSTPIEYRGKPALQIITLDITERKRMEAALIEAEGLRLALGQERELKELKSRFISMVSHQFRTPLSVISTTSYLLQNYNDKLPPEKREEYFSKIRAQIDRLDELIENILTISQKEENLLLFVPQQLDLETFVRDLTAEMQLTSELLHKLKFSAAGDFSVTWVDEKLLRHILMNLLSNAIKYSPNGGEVLVKLERQGDEAILQITDSGIGIPLDDQKHLFEPFHRGTNVAGIKGSGLGLKIVKDFVDLHGGTITCVSEQDKGTTFTLRLPIVQRDPEPNLQGNT
jgi:PAS domain S-box-containing protein